MLLRTPQEVMTHEWSFNAVEEQNFDHHYGRRDGVEVEDDEWLEPSLAEKIADCSNVISIRPDVQCGRLTRRADIASQLQHILWSISVIGSVARVVLQVVRSGNEPVDCRVHEGEDGGQCVKHGEVELLSEAGHVGGKRHELDKEALDAALIVLGVRVVKMGEGPGLQSSSAYSYCQREGGLKIMTNESYDVINRDEDVADD
jgi:hypothetical protein